MTHRLSERPAAPAGRAGRGRVSALGRLARSDAPRATLLVRLAVGAIFVSEGAQKFLFAAELGAGRFATIGLPAPGLLAPFVGATELACGSLVLVGLATRLAAAPLVVVMLVAIATTKLAELPKVGFWATAHGARTDWAMLLSALFLVAVGAGPWSLDARRGRGVGQTGKP